MDAFCLPIRAQTDGMTHRHSLHESIRTVQIPKSVFASHYLIGPLPGIDNIRRVAGQSDQLRYIIGGTTAFMQLNSITEAFFAKSITEFPTVVDWGVGCARVMRHFWELVPQIGLGSSCRQNIIGMDIDRMNVEWCKINMRQGEYTLISQEGFNLPNESVDFLYGISVMTHLAEYYQFRWLNEIRRVLRPRGCAVLTVHGERTYYNNPQSLALPFAEQFGFFDGIADPALGSDYDRYYRSSYHARKYIMDKWSNGFDVLDIIPASNAFLQDFVVLRRQ